MSIVNTKHNSVILEKIIHIFFIKEGGLFSSTYFSMLSPFLLEINEFPDSSSPKLKYLLFSNFF